MDFLYGMWCKITTLYPREYKPICANNYKYVRIMSYNVKALCAYYNAIRISKIVEYIENAFKLNKIDVICLQEAFEIDLLDQLYKLATRCSLNIIHPSLSRRYWIGENSGLVTISRFPIGDHKFLEYDVFTGLCSFAKKGAHNMEICLDGHIVTLVNTHLQSDNTDVSKKQLDMLIKWLDKPAIICGDFNLDYEIINTHSTEFRCVNQTKQITFQDTGEQFDYFLLYESELECTFRVLRNVLLSDHYPILMTFVLRGQGTYGSPNPSYQNLIREGFGEP